MEAGGNAGPRPIFGNEFLKQSDYIRIGEMKRLFQAIPLGIEPFFGAGLAGLDGKDLGMHGGKVFGVVVVELFVEFFAGTKACEDNIYIAHSRESYQVFG